MQEAYSSRRPAMRKVAAITIGQSPREDLTPDLHRILSPNIELCEFGALDGLKADKLKKLIQQQISPVSVTPSSPCQRLLVSRLRDGSEITFPEEIIIPLVQDCISKAELSGCEATLLLCTGEFPEFEHQRPLLIPRRLIYNILPPLVGKQKLGILLPNSEQKRDYIEHFDLFCHGLHRDQLSIYTASPYQSEDGVILQAKKMSDDAEPSLIYLDCFGYTIHMKKIIEKITGIPVLLPRTMMARILNELYGGAKC